MELNNTEQTLLYFMRCALQNAPPQIIPELDHEALYALSQFHSVTAMVAMVLESGGMLTEQHTTAENIKKWKDARVKAVRKNILLDEERAQILQHLDECGIWYLPLKGAILKDLYPKMGMRQMADNDILFDAAYQHPLKAYMESRGYQTVNFAKGNHDVYEKPPVYNFEFHTALFNEYRSPKLAAYYKDVKDRLQKDAQNDCGYHFSEEDFYIYILTHAYKHYSNSGTGIRFLSDIYVFLREKGKHLNWAYVQRELQTLEIEDFEIATKDLAEKLFGENEEYSLTEAEQNFLSYLMGAGTYGTRENWVNRELSEIQNTSGTLSWWIKIRYVLKRLFPDRMFMKYDSPFCRKHEWAIPFFWIYRMVKAVICKRKEIRAEIRTLHKAE